MGTSATLYKGKDLNKQQIQERKEIEQRLLGSGDKLDTVPEYLHPVEKAYYRYLIEELKLTNLICNIDIPLIEQTSHCLKMVQEAREYVNKMGILIEGTDRNGKNTLVQNPAIKIELDYMSKYNALCNQLCLSPKARADIAKKKADIKEEQEDPLLKILRGE